MTISLNVKSDDDFDTGRRDERCNIQASEASTLGLALCLVFPLPSLDSCRSKGISSSSM